MGQFNPLVANGLQLRKLTEKETAGVDFANWIRDVLAQHNPMVGYLAEMLSVEISETPMREAKGELQCVGSLDVNNGDNGPTFSI